MLNMTTTHSLPIQYLAFLRHFAALLELADVELEDAETVVLCAALNLLADHLHEIHVESREEEAAKLTYLCELAKVRERV